MRTFSESSIQSADYLSAEEDELTDVAEEDYLDDASDAEGSVGGRRRERAGSLLKDSESYYVDSAHAVHKPVDVGKYIEAWPRIPREELHGSFVQHPRFPWYRWRC